MTLRIGWGTDLHLDLVSPSQIAELGARFRAQKLDALVLTGDLAEADTLRSRLEALTSAIGVPTYFVLGNHDFYSGAVAPVRKAAAEFPFARYLRPMDPVVLAPGVILVGVDGWGDARYGSTRTSKVVLNDFVRIHDVRVGYLRGKLRETLQKLGKKEGERLTELLASALSQNPRHVVVATHVPPFPECAWHDGKGSDADHAPFFACQATGLALLHAADYHPGVQFTVLCGHSHGGGSVQKAQNLRVLTGAARYYVPAPQEPLSIP